EQERADHRAGALLVPAEAGDHAVSRALVLSRLRCRCSQARSLDGERGCGVGTSDNPSVHFCPACLTEIGSWHTSDGSIRAATVGNRVDSGTLMDDPDLAK